MNKQNIEGFGNYRSIKRFGYKSRHEILPNLISGPQYHRTNKCAERCIRNWGNNFQTRERLRKCLNWC